MTSARTACVGLEYGYRAGNVQHELGLWSWPIEMMQTVWKQLCPQHLRARARWNSRVPWAFPVPRAEGRRAVQSKEEPSLLPLLHALHLQAEGGEAGQEVCHFIHLLFGTCHLEAGTEVIQSFPLLMAPQALQVLP